MRTSADTTTTRPIDHIGVRLEPALVARLDALIPKLSTEWHEATRSDVIRAVLLRGLPDVETDPRGERTKETGKRARK